MTPVGPPLTAALSRRAALMAGASLLGLGAAACSGASSSGSEDGDVITIGCMPTWTDSATMAFVLRRQLEQLGHTVEFETFTDAAIAFTALSEGAIDLYSSAWPDVTHAAHVEEYGESLEDLVTYNRSATTMLAVPEYTDISSIEDLAADPARFDGRIIAIEPGAGLTTMVQDSVMPQYGMQESFELVTSSTPAMLTELQNAIDEQADAVFTLWRPFWAHHRFAVKPLEDPAGAFRTPESLHVMGRPGFTRDFAEAAGYIGQMALSDEDFTAVHSVVLDAFDDGEEAEAQAVASWIEANPEVLPAAGTA